MAEEACWLIWVQPTYLLLYDGQMPAMKKHKLVLESMIYTVAKQVGAMHVALHGQTDAVILTGGIANNKYCVALLREWLEGIARIVVIPGEDEMGALAMNALGALRGELPLQEYNPH